MTQKDEAKALVEAYDAAETLHEQAVAMPQGKERDAALVKSSQAKSRAADLKRAYSQKYMGGYSLGGREMGESRADYHSASTSFTTRRLVEALEDARRVASEG